MQRNIYHKIICSILFCLFALSITPTVYLHSVFAKHKDGGGNYLNQKGIKITPATFNCNIENCVAWSPYIPAMEVPEYLPVVHIALSYQFYTSSFFSIHHFYGELRGPPFC